MGRETKRELIKWPFAQKFNPYFSPCNTKYFCEISHKTCLIDVLLYFYTNFYEHSSQLLFLVVPFLRCFYNINCNMCSINAILYCCIKYSIHLLNKSRGCTYNRECLKKRKKKIQICFGISCKKLHQISLSITWLLIKLGVGLDTSLNHATWVALSVPYTCLLPKKGYIRTSKHKVSIVWIKAKVYLHIWARSLIFWNGFFSVTLKCHHPFLSMPS